LRHLTRKRIKFPSVSNYSRRVFLRRCACACARAKSYRYTTGPRAPPEHEFRLSLGRFYDRVVSRKLQEIDQSSIIYSSYIRLRLVSFLQFTTYNSIVKAALRLAVTCKRMQSQRKSHRGRQLRVHVGTRPEHVVISFGGKSVCTNISIYIKENEVWNFLKLDARPWELFNFTLALNTKNKKSRIGKDVCIRFWFQVKMSFFLSIQVLQPIL